MIGIHQSLTTLPNLVSDALALGADTFQFFIRNNRSSRRRSYGMLDLNAFSSALIPSGISTYVLHASYCMNPATADNDLHTKTKIIIEDDLYLLSYMAGVKKYVLHPGSSTDSDTYDALNYMCELLEEVKCKLDTTEICLEMMAGAGTQLLSDFKQVEYVANKLPWVKFTLDTCHVFAAGFPIDKQLQLFLSYIGVDQLGVIHLNNSKGAFSSRVDRHAPIMGDGNIPRQQLLDFALLATRINPNIPIILETPDTWLTMDFEMVRDYVKANLG